MSARSVVPAGGLDVDIRVARRSFEVAVSFQLERGGRLALFGPSGAGKTTIVETIAGLVRPLAGAVRSASETLSVPRVGPETERHSERSHRSRRRPATLVPPPAAVAAVSIVRQPTMLFPHLDVESNVAYGNADEALAHELVTEVGLAEQRYAKPSQLSGGQAQRAALARALARQFKVLLLDEPMAAVDLPSRPALWALVERRVAAEGAVAVLVTHDLYEAQAFGETLAVIDRGHVLRIGDPHEVVSDPRSRRAAEVVGYTGRLEVVSERGEALEFALHPDRVRPGALPEAGIVFAGKVSAVRAAGSGFRSSVAIPRGTQLDVPRWATCTTVTDTEITVESDERPSVGSPMAATALNPPLITVRVPEDSEEQT